MPTIEEREQNTAALVFQTDWERLESTETIPWRMLPIAVREGDWRRCATIDVGRGDMLTVFVAPGARLIVAEVTADRKLARPMYESLTHSFGLPAGNKDAATG